MQFNNPSSAKPKTKNMTTLHLRKSINLSPLRLGFLLIMLAVASFAPTPTARGVTPAPDGGYPNQNTAEGDNALLSLTTGKFNTAIGADALQMNTTGNFNTATGLNALFNNTTGSFNTATGQAALFKNTTGINNTANGSGALSSNTKGTRNTGSGVRALGGNTIGNDNTANGFFALELNTTGNSNTANGSGALQNNTTGTFNTASGTGALFANTTGINNTANGSGVLSSNTTGGDNSATGLNALVSNTTGSENTANGRSALNNNTTGGSNIVMGFAAGFNLTTGSNNIDIGSRGVAGESSKIRIGTKPAQNAAFIAGISGVTVANGVGVIVNPKGQLGTVVSSARFKEAIKPMDKASESILALNPVTFRYKHELDPDGISQFGLVAEQVEKVNPDLVVRDEDGNVNTVRYEAVNTMLLNEFLKEHRQVQELKGTVAQQQKQIEALTATVQKVSDQVAFNKPAPQLVANP